MLQASTRQALAVVRAGRTCAHGGEWGSTTLSPDLAQGLMLAVHHGVKGKPEATLFSQISPAALLVKPA